MEERGEYVVPRDSGNSCITRNVTAGGSHKTTRGLSNGASHKNIRLSISAPAVTYLPSTSSSRCSPLPYGKLPYEFFARAKLVLMIGVVGFTDFDETELLSCTKIVDIKLHWFGILNNLPYIFIFSPLFAKSTIRLKNLNFRVYQGASNSYNRISLIFSITYECSFVQYKLMSRLVNSISSLFD